MNPATLTPRPALSRARSRVRRGLSLFQALMVLGLAAGAVVGAVTLYNTTTEVQARNDTQALITTLVVAVQRIHQGAAGYGTGRLEPTLDARGSIPSNAKTASTGNDRIGHAFGGLVEVNGANQRFTITLHDLQRENCTQILDPYIGQTRSAGGLWRVNVRGRVSNLPLTPAAVTNICRAASNDLVLTFE